jgi:predicted GH43/DUF377 family glycosyl hydrolase
MFRRDPDRPILTAADLPFEANAVFNPGATTLPSGEVGLLVRIEDRRGLSAIHLARSPDGVGGWQVDREPLLAPDHTDLECEWGFEDARVSYVDELERYVITCTAHGRMGPGVYLATSTDLASIEEGRLVMEPEDKNAAVLPRRIDGQWWMLHRPVVRAAESADVWISASDDLVHWSNRRPVMLRRMAGWWDAARIGIGPPPIETPEGWLLVYHGVRTTVSGAIYRVGAALLEREQPWIVIGRLDQWIFSPTTEWERTGDVANVVFPCGMVCEDDQLAMYYGAADTVVGRAVASVSELLAALLEQPADSPGDRDHGHLPGLV